MSYAKLFDRIPDDVVLAAASRPMSMDSCTDCLLGWVFREEIAKVIDIDAEKIWPYGYRIGEVMGTSGGVPVACAQRFGGNEDDWINVFSGVGDSRLPVIETAWVERVDKAVRRSR